MTNPVTFANNGYEALSHLRRDSISSEPPATGQLDFETVDEARNALIESRAHIHKLQMALREISDFGRVNTGCGYSCHKMAEAALHPNPRDQRWSFKSSNATDSTTPEEPR